MRKNPRALFGLTCLHLFKSQMALDLAVFEVEGPIRAKSFRVVGSGICIRKLPDLQSAAKNH